MIDKLGVLSIMGEINNTNKYDILSVISKKIDFFYNIIQKTIIHIQKIKSLDILGISDVSVCIDKLNEINLKILNISKNLKENSNTDTIINSLQNINNDLSSLLKNYGTDSFEDLVLICFGTNNKVLTLDTDNLKLNLLKKYFHPTSYKILPKKDENKNKKSDLESIGDESYINLDCLDISSTSKQFHLKVNGIKVIIISESLKKSLIVYGIVDDIIIDFLNNEFILNKKQELINIKNKNLSDTNDETYKNYINSLTIKDYLINNTPKDFYDKFIGINTQVNNIKQKQISSLVKEFILDDIFIKRNTLINLLIHSNNCENQYLSYLLYDLLSNESNGSIDTQEQIILYDSLPWSIKQHFKNAMKKTIQYTNELSNFEINKIPLEQQICLLKASESVKEKAMIKLKEVKSKSEDSGSKARQYLDGLLKIPFNIYKKEPILNVMDNINTQFKDLFLKYNLSFVYKEIPVKNKYTSIEILNYFKQINDTIKEKEVNYLYDNIKKNLIFGDKPKLQENIILINDILKNNNLKENKIKYTTLRKDELKEQIENCIEKIKLINNGSIINELFLSIKTEMKDNGKVNFIDIKREIEGINLKLNSVKDYITNVKNTLDTSVYGHDKAKKQVERIIAQWINGEMKGYACGFEGPPGVGKTSLAKGLSECLKDENGVSRPFSLIAIGGDSNASTLIGHSYTYVGSTWGQIVQILMDKKCMNPIILIDEVDKISKTEHGKEIIGVLTHLLDPTQNDTFQDKYFSGVELDLSKVLFILSYNDVHAIDRIMLDRINRIKFDNLSLEDKIVICNKHLLPDIYKNVGLHEMIELPDDVLKYIIDEYTLEAGVRKLKEILFEIIGEINLEILKMNMEDIKIPIKITIDDVKNKYFKDKREQILKKVFDISKIGFVNGMYATTLGSGGTLPIHAQFFPSNKFLELKLTGLQQEVMRESMHVALTVAWNLTGIDKQQKIRELYDEKYKCGINIHTGDGSVQKDGPSAGCAITCAIYSILNDIPIKPEFGITGEIQMSGEVTAIGGLSHKILGSLKSSVKNFIYPKDNKKDFDDFIKKYKDSDIIKNIQFYAIEHVNEALELLLDK